MSGSASSSVRLVEVAAALANAGDLAMGQPIAHGLRAAVLAVRLGSAAGADIGTRDAAFYTTLLRWSGCTANAHEFSRFLGNDVAGRAALQLEPHHTGPGSRPTTDRAGPTPTEMTAAADEHCEVAQLLARRLGLPDLVVDSLGQVFERHDGTGLPHGLGGDAVTLPAKLAVLAGDIEILTHHLGAEHAREQLAARAGRAYDRGLAAMASTEIHGWLENLPEHPDDLWAWALDQEPVVRAPLPSSHLDQVTTALAEMVDVKVPHLAGHSHLVADVVARAAVLLGLPADRAEFARRAALVHDVGRIAVPNTVWERDGRLGPIERAQAELHPYYTGQVLEPVAALRDIGAVASTHHEHLDGTGYHRQLRHDALPPVARLLGAADAWASMRLTRPLKPALAAPDAAARLQQAARDGALDHAATAAVLEAADQPLPALADLRPGGVTPRETEVLGLLVEGMTNAQIAARLGVATKTVDNHVQNVYGRLGVRSRAAATIAALRAGLVSLHEDPHG
ncbi:MAG: HD domain-containing phosphohydrolase [Dermatophilaceae bacterium]